MVLWRIVDINININILVNISVNISVNIKMNIRHKGFKKDCPDGELTEAGFIKIYTQVRKNLHLHEKKLHQGEKNLHPGKKISLEVRQKFCHKKVLQIYALRACKFRLVVSPT